jgi:hypothetical protein
MVLQHLLVFIVVILACILLQYIIYGIEEDTQKLKSGVFWDVFIVTAVKTSNLTQKLFQYEVDAFWQQFFCSKNPLRHKILVLKVPDAV